MKNRHSMWQLPTRLLAGAAMASALLFTAQAQAAGNPPRGGVQAPQVQPNNVALKTQGGHHNEGVKTQGGHHHDGDQFGGRGRPTSVRPHHPHHPPRPVVVVPPCKRGGHGITPC